MSRAVEEAEVHCDSRAEAIALACRALVQIRLGLDGPSPASVTGVIGGSPHSLFELASVYQSLLERAAGTLTHTRRKQQGAYYTPIPLVDHLVERSVLKTFDEFDGSLDSFRVCDPAVGVGAFLLRSVHLIADRVGGEDRQRTLDVIVANCLYGVDIDPTAAMLCRAVLASETSDPAGMYEHLQQHIKVGNAVVGATPELIEAGIPSEAFGVKPGDDKHAASVYKRRNTSERRVSRVTHPHNEDPDPKLSADAWCAAFVWPLREIDALGQVDALTQGHLDTIRTAPEQLPAWMRTEIQRLAQEHSFFHWHLEFPEVIAARS